MLQDPYLIKHLKGFLHEPEQCRIARVSKVFARNNVKRRPGFGRCSGCGDWADSGKEWTIIDRPDPPPGESKICWHEQQISHCRLMSLVHGSPLCDGCAPKLPDKEYYYYNYVTPFRLPRCVAIQHRALGLPGSDYYRYSVPQVGTERRGWHLMMRKESGSRWSAQIYRTGSDVCRARFCDLVMLALVLLGFVMMWLNG